MTAAIGPRYQSPLPYTGAAPSSAVVYCSDGRLGEHIDEFMTEGLGLGHFDRIAVPGGAGCLAGNFATWREEKALTGQMRFLIEAHQLRRVVLVAHQDCGHYLQRLRLQAAEVTEQQGTDLRQAARRIRQLAFRLQVEAYIARHDDGRVSFVPVTV